uniref:Neuroblast differentiation-associated protein AHNAK-like n=1 Tax=Sinocyclocheilus rhinocerous TaxID=307959 RepID=A0A673N048_9TELE
MTAKNIDTEGHASTGVKYGMTKLDISLPKITSPEGEVIVEEPGAKGGTIHKPNISIPLPKGKGEAKVDGHSEKGPSVKMPQIDISLPKMKLPQGKIDIEGPEVDISLPNETLEGDANIEDHFGKGGKIKMPRVDVSLPNVKSSEHAIAEGHDIKAGKLSMPSIEISLPIGGISIEGSDSKRLNMPSVDISFPKVTGTGNVDLKRHSGKIGKFDIPKLDISLLKFESTKGELSVEGPEFKGGKLNIPSYNISSDVCLEGETKKGTTFQMPKLDINLPQIKSVRTETNIEEPEVKGGKIDMPDVDISLPRVKVKGDGKVNVSKGGKFHMPQVDLSLPKMKTRSMEVNIEGPEVKGSKVHTPSLDISLPKDKTETNIDIEGHSGTGMKYEMPTIDVSLPKVKASEGDVAVEGQEGKERKFGIPKFDVSLPKFKPSGGEFDIEGPDIKVGKIHMPSVDISLPGGGAGGDVDVEGPAGKGRKFEMPKFDVSLPKLKPSGCEMDVEGPDIKGGTFHMPSIDISLPGGGAGRDVDVEGHAGKGRKFEMPKLKTSEGEVDVQGPNIKGGKIHMPSIDISLPGGGAGRDVDVEGPAGKGRKFEMSKLDVSLPKLKPLGGEIDIEGPNIKGGKIHMPSIDISLPGGGAGGDVDVEGRAGKGRKFEMPKLDVSLPKLKQSGGEMDIEGGEINVEGPNIKGGKIHMPSIDISLPGGGAGGDVDVEGPAGKGRKFEMPKFDVSLPKLKTSGGEMDIECPDIKGGKFHMPSIDISLAGGGAGGDVDVEGHAGKGRKFKMPKLDVSLPKLKPSGGEVDVQGPNIKGEKFHMPSIDISLPGGGAGGNVDVEGPAGKGRKFDMPKLDVSLPKLKPSGGEIDIEDPDIKGGKFHMPSIDISLPGTAEGGLKLGDDTKKGLRFHMPTVDISVPKMKLTDRELKTKAKISDLNVPEVTFGGNIKLPSVKIPTVDISAPKVDLDFTLPKGKGSDRENIELLKAEGGRPSSGASFDVPEVSVKMPKISLPKFGRKLKSAEEITKPEFRVEGPEDKVKSKLKFPKFKTPTPKAKLKDVEMGMPGYVDNKGKVRMPAFEISLPTANIPECEVLLPKTGVDVSEADIRGYEGSLKIPKKPKIDISVPKVDLDVSLPRVKLHEPVDSTDLNTDGSRGTVNFPHVKVPKVDISLPHAKTGATDNHEVEVGRKGKLRMPEVEISLPHAKRDTPYTDTEIKGEKLKDVEMGMPGYVDNKGKVRMPAFEISLPTANIPECEVLLPKTEVDVSEADIRGYEGSLKIPKKPKIDISVPKVDLDVSLPRLKLHEPVDSTDLNTDGSRGTVNFPHVKIPKVDISLPHVEVGRKGKLRMPEVEISLPHAKRDTPYTDTEIKGEKLKIPKMSVPSVDISLPHGKENDDPDIEFGVKGSKLKMPDIIVPKIDFSLPHGRKEESHALDSELEGGKLKTPKIDIPLPKIKSKDVVSELQPDVGKGKVMIPGIRGSMEVKGGQCKIPDIKIPQVDISLPESRTGEFDTKEGESGGGGGKLTMPNVKIPKLDIGMSRDADMSDPSTDASLKDSHKEGKKTRMPNVDLELDLGLSRDGKKNKKKSELQDTDLEPATKEKIKGPKVKGTKFNIGMPKVKVSGLETYINKSEKMDAKFLKGGTDANLKADLQAPKIPELDFDIETAQADTNNSDEDKKQTGKVKIPKFGIPLPSLSSPEANIKSSQGKGHSINMDSKVEYESPRLPKVTKAVFVMVNPQTESSACVGGEASAEIGDVKIKQPKIKMKPNFGKSRSNEKGRAIYCEDEVETGKLKLPKVTFSSGQRGSFDVTPSGSDDGTSPSLNGDKDEKTMFGKLKLPKVEFFSPYSKDASEEEELETSMKLRKESSGESKESKESKTISGTMSFPGLKKKTEKDEEVRKISTIVSSKARTEMLAEREGSESPVPTVSSGFVSVMKCEEREETTWFKVPKVTLSPHSTDILHITPESSPKGSKSSLPCSIEEASGGFYVKMPSVEFLTHEMPSEHLITKTEGTLTVVTKTTKYTETKCTSSKQ